MGALIGIAMHTRKNIPPPLEQRVTDTDEIQAVSNGEIEGQIYKDRECWANTESLGRWRIRHTVCDPYDLPPP